MDDIDKVVSELVKAREDVIKKAMDVAGVKLEEFEDRVSVIKTSDNVDCYFIDGKLAITFRPIQQNLDGKFSIDFKTHY